VSKRNLYFLGAAVGSTAGGLAPGLWGASDFSGWAIFLSTVGGLFGIWVAYKLSS
jgi:hypothetical protein